MSKIDDGGPAFPHVAPGGYHSCQYESGMSLRRHYAGLAMQGQLSCGDIADSTPAGVAKYALEYADALIAALKLKEEK